MLFFFFTPSQMKFTILSLHILLCIVEINGKLGCRGTKNRTQKVSMDCVLITWPLNQWIHKKHIRTIWLFPIMQTLCQMIWPNWCGSCVWPSPDWCGSCVWPSPDWWVMCLAFTWLVGPVSGLHLIGGSCVWPSQVEWIRGGGRREGEAGVAGIDEGTDNVPLRGHQKAPNQTCL